tara:strand:+ start:451 stop:684 length:234 start_codon:yes stop_codon:yes gene_type:complete
MFTIDKIYKYAETGKVADFGVGLTDINGGKKWERIGPDIVVAEKDFDPTKIVNETCTLTEITDATELAAVKTTWKIS